MAPSSHMGLRAHQGLRRSRAYKLCRSGAVIVQKAPRQAMASGAVLARYADPARLLSWRMPLVDCRSHQSYTWSIRQTVSQGRQIAAARPELRRVRPAVALNTGPEMSSSHCRQPLIDPSSRL